MGRAKPHPNPGHTVMHIAARPLVGLIGPSRTGVWGANGSVSAAEPPSGCARRRARQVRLSGGRPGTRRHTQQ
eukprot:5975216-Pyramimonas_sp.AAC.1